MASFNTMTWGGANGAALGPDGRCYVCNNGGISDDDIQMLMRGLPVTDRPRSAGYIQAVDLGSSTVETVYDACDGAMLSAPNDIVLDATGGFYFTDYGNPRDRAPLPRAVFYARPGGLEIRCLAPDLQRANGVGLSPPGDFLYVAETTAGRLWSIPVPARGRPDVDRRAVLFENPRFGMDSLAVQADGRICVASPSRDVILSIDRARGAESISSRQECRATSASAGLIDAPRMSL